MPRRHALARSVLAGTLASLLVLATPAGAQEPPPPPPEEAAALVEMTPEEAQLLAERERVDAEKAAVAADVAAAEAQARAAASQAAAAETRLAAAEVRLVEAEMALSKATLEEERAAAAVRRWRARLAETIQVIKEQAVSAFMHGSSPQNAVRSMADLVDADDSGRAIVLVTVVLDDQHDRKATTEATLARAERRHDSAVEAVAAATAARDEHLDVRQQAEAAREGAVAQHRAVVQQRDTVVKVLNGIEGDLAFLEGRVAEAYVASRQSFPSTVPGGSIGALLQGRQAGQPQGGLERGRLGMPVRGAVVSSGFGPRVHPLYGEVRVHAGIDFAVAHGIPIIAAADGVVVFAGPAGGYGTTVVIDHGEGLATLSAHMSRLATMEGAQVEAGQVIGYVGSTGASTGPHLHFEARNFGEPINPIVVLGADTDRSRAASAEPR